MAIARWLETDSNSNKDISSAAEIGAYTADADRLIVVDVSVDQVAGNGDYVIYVTRQINGAGSAYVLLPKTTCAAASGETAIAMQSGPVTVRSGDVLTVYVDGLAGDTTTPDITVRWFEMATLRPATADRQLTVAATGEASANVTLWKDATAPAMTGDAYAVVTNATYGLDKLARTGADGDTLETLSDQLDAIDVNGTAAAVWAYTPRTLTQTAAAVASVMAGTSLTITRGDTLSATLTGLGNITGYANLWFTVKWATSDLDAAAIIQIDTDTGLLTVNGAAATAGNGSITVDDATAGDITIALAASVTDDLTPATGLVYDVQWQSGTSIYTLTSGVAVVSADVTRAVA